jgi:predicted ATPase/DNA-binding SARP family transcriptional activator
MQIDVDLLGVFEVRVGGQALPGSTWKLRHPRQLLQMLALQPGLRMSRDQVCDHLWPLADADAAGNRLHHTIHVLRTAFVRAGVPKAEPVLTMQAGALQLNPAHAFAVDVSQFGSVVEQARKCHEPDRLEPLLQAAVALYRGELLSGSPHEDWLSAEREQCRLEVVWALGRLADLRREGRDVEQATLLLQTLVDIEPTNEAAHRALMELFEAADHPERAVYQYAACKRALQRDLDVAPSPLTQAVLDRIVARGRALSARAVVVKPAPMPAARYVVPPHAIPMLARDADLALLRGWIVADAARWVTITGAAGMGKTRLAHAVVAACQDHFKDGVAVVPLTALGRGADLSTHLAAVLRAGGNVEDAPADRLRRHLRGRHLLLLLDRFEHILDAGALITDLLAACPTLAVLVTSQVALHREAERVFVLPTLLARGTQDALALFCRVCAARGVSIDQPDELAAANAICERLEGNALAIELAAGQRQVLTSVQILRELDHPLELLTNPARDAEAPQRSLKHAIAWSFGLLPEASQGLFCAFSVFPAAFDVGDAVRVLAPLASEAALRACLERLVERHLVSRTPDAEPGSPGASYLLLDSIGQFAREKLAGLGIAPAVHAAHADHFTRLARELSVQLREGRSADAVRALRRCQADLLAALRWQERHGRPEDHGELAYHCAGFALMAGEAARAIEILRPATRAQRDATPAQRKMLAWCSYRLARAHAWHTDRSEALRAIRAARLFAKGCDDTLLDDKIMMQLAVERINQTRHRLALFHLDKLIQRHRVAADSPRLVAEYALLASIQHITGDPRAAVVSARLGLDHALRTGSPQLFGFALMTLAEASMRAGDADAAQQHLDECRLIPANAFSVLRLLHLSTLDTFVAFESLAFDDARSVLHTALGRVQSAGRASSKLFVQIMLDLLAIEIGRPDDVNVLPHVDIRKLPRNVQLTDLIVRLWCYRIRYFSVRGQWWRALDALRHVVELLERSPNAIWRSLVYEVCCFAMLERGEWRVCRVLLAHSRKSLTAAKAGPTPRQAKSWARIEAALSAAPVTPAARGSLAPTAWRVSDARSFPQLLACMETLLVAGTGPVAERAIMAELG